MAPPMNPSWPSRRLWRQLLWLGALALLAAPALADEALARRFAAAALRAGDTGGRAFAVVSKPAATVWVFDRHGQLLASSAVLLGQATGDAAPPDVGSRPLHQLRPHEKVTSAGRFLTEAETRHPDRSVVPIESMVKAYYRKKGYDAEGKPTPRLLSRLGIPVAGGSAA